MNKIEVYSKSSCPHCDRAKSLLNAKGVDYVEIDISDDEARTLEMIQRSRQRTVPQIFINDEAIGGFSQLAQLNARGVLDRKLDLEEYHPV